MSPPDTPSDNSIRDQASYWANRLDDPDFGSTERAELHRWLLTDPRHADELRLTNAIPSLAHDFPPEIRARLSALVPIGAEAATQPQRRRWGWASALAAGVVLVVVVAGWFLVGRPQLMSHSYATRTGETRTVTFQDGSVAYLNTRSKLKWTGNERDRRVELLEGEALFDVVHDPARPFRVLLDNSEICVRGTRFDVYRKKDGETVVTVLEGLVDVHERVAGNDRPAWQRNVGANQQIVYRPLGVLRDVRDIPAGRSVKWREGLMEIQDQPLPEVLEELTRYTDQRIVIRNPLLNQLRVGGVLPVRDVRVALARLQKLAPVSVTENGNTFTLDYQTEQSTTTAQPDAARPE